MKADIELQQRRLGKELAQPNQAADSVHGLLLVFTGTGKGKSSAAFGMGMRALMQQMKLGVVQFCGGSATSSEYQSMGQHPLCDFQICGSECSWQSKDRHIDIANVNYAWSEAKRMIEDPSYGMVILDDINLLLKHQYLNLDHVMQTLRKRRRDVHIVMTGRYAPFELIDFADLVTEMRAVKHPFPNRAIPPQTGIEF